MYFIAKKKKKERENLLAGSHEAIGLHPSTLGSAKHLICPGPHMGGGHISGIGQGTSIVMATPAIIMS